MSDRTRRVLAWVLVAGSFAGWGATAVYRYLLDTSGAPRAGADATTLYIVVGVAVAIVSVTGGFIVSRNPRNVVGWIFVLSSLVVALKAGSDAYVELGHYVHHDAFAAIRISAWFSDWIWLFGIVPFATLVFLLFPTGRPPSPRWRFVAYLSGTAMVLAAISVAFAPTHLDQFPYYRNPFAAPKALAPIVSIAGLGFALIIASVALSIASLVFRARSGDPVVREQIKWIAYAGAFLICGLAYSFFASSFTASYAIVIFGPIAGIAVAAAIAIQRYRLFDIDRLISRTLAYAVVTAILGGSFALVIVAASAFVRGAPDYVIAIATLAVAALFRPVRRRVQSAIDRRFDRGRFDVERTIQGFAVRLRQQLDLNVLENELCSVVESTMHPQRVSLWVRSRPD